MKVELKQIRDKELYSVYVDSITKYSFSSIEKAVDYSRKHSASRFYIEARTASLIIGKIESKISLISYDDASIRRIWVLYDMYQGFLQCHPDTKLSRERILEILVDEPAPEFYLSMTRAKHIILEERAKARKRFGL